MKLTELQWINQKDWRYKHILSELRKSADLWNAAVEINTEHADKTDKSIMWYNEMDKVIKNSVDYKDLYSNMPSAQSAQQLLRLYNSAVKGTLLARKAFSKDKSNFNGYPQFPKRKVKDAWAPIIFTNQNAKLKENKIIFPKKFCGNTSITFKPYFTQKYVDAKLCVVTFIKRKNKIGICIVYEIDSPKTQKPNKKILGIDLGVNNLATCVVNFGLKPFIISGKPVKSINQWYNKEIAHYKSIADKRNITNKKKKWLKASDKNISRWTRKLDNITEKRNNFIENYMHKSSRLIVDYCVAFDIREIVIGHNKGQKYKSNISRVGNRTFVQIPFNSLIDKIKYKSELEGIRVIEHEESYTSKSSFLDRDPIPKWKQPKKGEKKKVHKFSGQRKFRGLYVSKCGIIINADVNGAANIIRKSKRNAFSGPCKGLTLAPVIVDSRSSNLDILLSNAKAA